MKQELVDESYDNSTSYCERCDNYYCFECIPFHKVDFDIIEIIEDAFDNKAFHKSMKGVEVCPWCYNQLVEKKNKLEIPCENCEGSTCLKCGGDGSKCL